MSKKKYTPFHSQNENYKHTCTFNLTTYISSFCLLAKEFGLSIKKKKKYYYYYLQNTNIYNIISYN